MADTDDTGQSDALVANNNSSSSTDDEHGKWNPAAAVSTEDHESPITRAAALGEHRNLLIPDTVSWYPRLVSGERDRRGSFPAGLDLSAISVASLYDTHEDFRSMDRSMDFSAEQLADDRWATSREAEAAAAVDNGVNYEARDVEVTVEDMEEVDVADGPFEKVNVSDGVDAPRNIFDNKKSENESLYFNDGKRSIDFVLAWKRPEVRNTEEKINEIKRAIFEENLRNEGLEVETEEEGDLYFVKLHAPLEVLRRYAEILKLRMPMKESLCVVQETGGQSVGGKKAPPRRIERLANQIPGLTLLVRTKSSLIVRKVNKFWAWICRQILVDEVHFPPISHRFTAVYSRDKEYLFDVTQACFFTAAVRSRIVQFILDRKRYSTTDGEDYAFGIERLLNDEVYLAAYPLHDGEISVPGSMRYLLYNEWAAIKRWYRYQPLDYIKDYFGVKIGLYFAWLGFYTYMLLLASLVGVLCFIYSWSTMDDYKLSQDICEGETFKMCPQCDHWCDYWDIKETCLHSRVQYLFDNPVTVFFAVFMSFWATIFLELWKRYSAEITHRWDLTGFDVHEEHPRPQYLARLAHVRKKKVNVVTNQMEPHVPFWRVKLPATILSFSIVILLVALAFAAVLAVVLYRMSLLAALSVYGDSVTTSGVILFTTATAASINLILIILFNYLYTILAEYLTEVELLRTQTEFDDSLTLKIYLLQFVNYYASIFYIAFFKGKFIGYPGNYNRLFEYRQEECGYGGCLMELCIQLAIIMVGKQTMNSILEMLLPRFYQWMNLIRVKAGGIKKSWSGSGKRQRWLRDLKLVEWGPRSLFPEYLEMVLQYGFVTIFVAAFPLAPFFALINNILEMRLDAKKLLTFHRRPVSQRVRDIGIWYRILDSIGKLSVITNGFIIAFTSDFIPRLIYQTSVSKDGTLTGYLNFSLSYFDINDFQGRAPNTTSHNATTCRYPDFREPPWSPNAYEKSSMYWLILAAKLGFVVVFENLVAVVMIFVRWGIPDMSHELRDQIRREAYITNEIIIKQEMRRARCEANNERDEEELEESAHLAKMQRLMHKNLTQSQLDLLMHGDNSNPVAPGNAPKRKKFKVFNKNNRTNEFLESQRV